MAEHGWRAPAVRAGVAAGPGGARVLQSSESKGWFVQQQIRKEVRKANEHGLSRVSGYLEPRIQCLGLCYGNVSSVAMKDLIREAGVGFLLLLKIFSRYVGVSLL